MPLVYHRRYQWPPARTESGRVVYRLDLILLFLMFFGLANVHVVFGWQALAGPDVVEAKRQLGFTRGGIGWDG